MLLQVERKDTIKKERKKERKDKIRKKGQIRIKENMKEEWG
jgi:hypothetical protein